MIIHTRQSQVRYIAAAIPAFLLPFSYIVIMAPWVFTLTFPATFGGHSAEPSALLNAISLIGICGTFVQWPFYFLWVIRSRELTIRLRVLWLLVLFSFNMFAIPWFLYCKYRGTAQTALTRGIRPGSIRRFFEKGTKPETPAV
jgi:hypothetical protein